MMTRSLLRTPLRSLVAVAALLITGEAALAQSALCQRYRAELANMNQSGGGQAAMAAERQRAELGRLQNYYRSIGCERGPFGGFFGGSAPQECGSIAQRLRQMESTYARLAAQANEVGGEARRRQLEAAVQQTCNAPQEAAAPRNFLESLFGPPRGSRPVEVQPMPEDPNAPPVEGEQQALGGRRLVCVRTCDGFYFPLASTPNGREGADEMCQALCPGTETAAFAMPGSDDAITRAVSLKGKPYMAMPTALKFQKSFDGACSCKKETESWALVLRRAEGMLDQRKGDVLVTAQKAEELSRPKAPAPAPAAKRPDPKRAQADAAEAESQAQAGAAAPTASQESSGIGPKSIETGRVIPRGEGPRQELATGDGTRRSVRVVAPNVIPVPTAQAR
ncbi:MAG TPA: DUF2865 domain-containing protein [Microvirga sp.]|jgi:hypothetical protein